MLYWDEEATPSASLPQSFELPNPLLAQRYAGPAAVDIKYRNAEDTMPQDVLGMNAFIMTNPISQNMASPIWHSVLCTQVHAAGTAPNSMNHLTHTNLREVFFAN
jgi:hypothetical protein